MQTYVHPLTDEKVAINKALIARVIEHLNEDPYNMEKRNIVYELEEVLHSDEIVNLLEERIDELESATNDLSEQVIKLEDENESLEYQLLELKSNGQ